MKALVTGASGFLGRSVVRRLLSDGFEVRALVRAGRRLDCTGVEVYPGDICDEAAVAGATRGMDLVVHCAARVETSGKWEEFAEVNVRGTRRVIRAAQSAGVRCIVHISSLGVYAVPHDGVSIGEESAYESEGESRGHYSRSKLAADRLALDAARRGAPVVVLRPGLLYGPGKRPPLARQSFSVKRFKLILATRRYPLPLAYVDNVADAVLLAARSDAAIGNAFTIVDENVSQVQYVDAYCEASGETWHPVFLPVRAVAVAALVLERGLRLARRRSPITYHQVRRATLAANFDCSRAERLLGWRPAVGVREGLQRTFESLRRDAAHTGTAAVASVPS
ncbi:MAG: NAD-dependent epimerase/dehydratase family protein [Candidatus Binatia bacterium]